MTTPAILDMIGYYTQRIAEEEAHLEYALTTPGFRLVQSTAAGDVDVTDTHIDGLRKAIKDYKRGRAYLMEP